MELTDNIITYIFAQLGIFNPKINQSIISSQFLLPEKLKFQTDDSIIENDIWGCQFNIENQELKILAGDLTIDKSSYKEYCLIVHLNDTPVYGLSLSGDWEYPKSLIAFSLNGEAWMKCNVYLQATFLAAMEQLKDHFLIPNPISSYQNIHRRLISFINFHYSEFENEG